MVPAGRIGRRRGSGRAWGARFLSRYPVLLLVPLSAGCLLLSYLYAYRLAGSWSDIHGAKAAAVSEGAALGVALVIAAVVGCRQGVSAWLLVSLVALAVGLVVTIPRIAPPVGSVGKVTTGFEAAVIALCSVLWFAGAFGFLGMMPRLWRVRTAFSRPGPSLHITRAAHWSEASTAPIPFVEWRQFAESRDDLTAFDPRAADQSLASLDAVAKGGGAARRLAVRERQLRASRELIATRMDLVARNPDLGRVLPPGFPISIFAHERADGSRMYLTWLNGQIVIAGLGRDRASDVASMQPIAWSLAAHLVDDDGRVWHASRRLPGQRDHP
jgi:hypothetical protein